VTQNRQTAAESGPHGDELSNFPPSDDRGGTGDRSFEREECGPAAVSHARPIDGGLRCPGAGGRSRGAVVLCLSAGTGIRADSLHQVRVADWGPDREATRDLVRHLGLEDCVSFVPFGDKEHFYENVRQAHVVVDQFSLGAVGLTGIEAMALGRPVMAYVKDDLAHRAYGTSIPGFNCATADDVSGAIARLSPYELSDQSRESAEWVNTYHSDARILKILTDVYSGIVA